MKAYANAIVSVSQQLTTKEYTWEELADMFEKAGYTIGSYEVPGFDWDSHIRFKVKTFHRDDAEDFKMPEALGSLLMLLSTKHDLAIELDSVRVI